MDIYLTYLETGDTLRFPMLPEKVETSLGNQFASYTVLGLGEVRVPSGTYLDKITWSGLFPGELRKQQPFVKEWQAPLEIYKWLENVKAKAGTSKKLRLLVTETVINMDVYLDTLSGDYTGGQGDFSYNISFIQAKDLIVTSTATVSEETTDTSSSSSNTVERSEPPSDNTYTVVSGDSLWAIAQRYYGSGSRYGEIYAANQNTIDTRNSGTGNSKYTIYPGQVFSIP